MHQKCKNDCGKVLVCGHICKVPCSQVCPPCQEKCTIRCEHSRCGRRCGEPCTPCKEPCDWECPHDRTRCTKRCGEKCSRDPCSRPCTWKLGCGHRCAGLCGEPCHPKLCTICNKDELTEIFLGSEDTDGARFVILEDCGHFFEVSDLDRWMTLETKGEGGNSHAILVRRCPRCNTLVTKSRRYQIILKACMDDVGKVKSIIFGGRNEARQRLREFASRLKQSQAEAEHDFFAQFLLHAIYTNPDRMRKRPKDENMIFKKIDQYTLESLSHMLNWWEDACESKAKLTEPLRKDLISRYSALLEIVQGRGLLLSKLEIKQFNMEFRRLAYLFQLYRRGSTAVIKEESVQTVYAKVKGTLLTVRPYSDDSAAEFKAQLAELDAVLKEKAPTFAAEEQRVRQATFEAVAADVTSWYKCQCGNLYGVGNCGQLNESGRCDNCKARIGRGSGNSRVADAHRPPILPPTENLEFDF